MVVCASLQAFPSSVRHPHLPAQAGVDSHAPKHWGGGHGWEFVAHFPATGGRESCFKWSLYVQSIMGCYLYVYIGL